MKIYLERDNVVKIVDSDAKVGKLVSQGFKITKKEGVDELSSELTVEQIAKKLDTKYKSEEIKTIAIEMNMNIDPQAKKADVIAAIIEAGKHIELIGCI